jgi:hypothetical protein
MFQDLDLRTWVTGPQREVSGSGSQDLGFRTSKSLHPTVVLSFSRHFSLRPVVTDGQTDVGPRYLALKTWVSGPRKLSIVRWSYLFPFLCVHRHFSLRPVVTDGQTDVVNLYIRYVADHNHNNLQLVL